MKDFDASRNARYDRQEREFRIGGEDFVRLPSIRPEELMEWEDLTGAEPAADQMRIIDDAIMLFIDTANDPGAHDRYRRARLEAKPPLSITDIQELLKWLIESNADRPTGRPGVSSPGPEATTTRSTDDSSSQELREAQPA